jgi:hypothetical protein
MFAVCLSVFSLFACGPDQVPAQQRALLIEQIQAARAMDLKNLTSGNTDSFQAADSVYQAQKARIVIDRLKRGEDVSQFEIDDALEVPPESVPPDANIELIRELKIAEGRDELGEQTHSPADDWLAWDSYREQKDLADRIAKALESGKKVPWSEIQAALQVPESP